MRVKIDSTHSILELFIIFAVLSPYSTVSKNDVNRGSCQAALMDGGAPNTNPDHAGRS